MSDDNEHKGKRPKYDLPTKDEQKNLQQVESLMRSNLIQLQTTELLTQVNSAKLMQNSQIVDWLQQLTSDLQDSSLKNSEINQEWLNKHHLTGIQLSKHANDMTLINFTKPSSVERIGSNASSTGTAPLLNVDFAVTIPETTLIQKDILNHQYFDKRKLYLAGLIQSLKDRNKKREVDAHYKISLSLFKGDVRKPIIIVEPSFNNFGLSVRVIPVISATVFRLVQLRAGKNNVRPEYWNKLVRNVKKKGKKDSELDPSILPGTPLYNCAILEDMAVITHNRIIAKTVVPHSNLREAAVLFKVWLTQRSMRYSVDGFDGHLAVLLLAYLVQTRRISTNSTPVVAFQTALSFLVEVNLLENVLDFTNHEIVSAKTVEEYHNDKTRTGVLSHPIVAASGDSTDSINFNAFWRVSKSALLVLRAEAQKSLKELQVSEETCFDNLFMLKRNFFASHDMFFHVPVNSELVESQVLSNKSVQLANDGVTEDFNTAVERELHDALLDHNSPTFLAAKMRAVVVRALGDRAVAVHTFIRNVGNATADRNVNNAHNPIIKVNQDPADQSLAEWVISIGVLVSKENYFRRVDRESSGEGVSDEVKKASELEFTTFWGEKSQLRRFGDGAIVEAVVWEPKNVSEQVVRHALGRHVYCVCGETAENVSHVSTQLETQYFNSHVPCSSKLTTPPDGCQAEDTNALTTAAVKALDSLRGILTSQIKNIPLSFESLMAVSPELRYTAIHAPRTHPVLLNAGSTDKAWLNVGQSVSMLSAPLKVIAKLESSGKWPVEPEAIRKSKTALLLRTRSELMKQFQIQSVIHEDSLDINYSGYIFRLVLAAQNDTEVMALGGVQSSSSNSAATKPGEVSEAEQMEDALMIQAIRTFDIPPLHHLAVKSLASMFPSFAAAVRLLAIWSANHYFSGHFSQEAMELIVAFEYLHPATLLPPASALAGFQCALSRIATHNWEADPLIVDLSVEAPIISVTERIEIIARFRNARATGKGQKNKDNVPMYIVSSSDKATGYHSSLIQQSPEKVIFNLIVNAARISSARLLFWIENAEVATQKPTPEILHEVMYDNSVLGNCNAYLQLNSNLHNHTDINKGPAFARVGLFANTPQHEVSITSLVVQEALYTSNPVQEQIFRDLRAKFGDHAVFLWNGIAGREIGVIWRPKLFVPNRFAILSSRLQTIVSPYSDAASSNTGSTLTIPNVSEILSHIVQATNGLVANVVVK